MKIRKGLRIAFCSIVLFALCGYFRIIGFGPVRIHNSPLLNPMLVKSISANHLVLANGREYAIELFPLARYQELQSYLHESDQMVEISSSGANGVNFIWVKRKRFVCGLGAPLIEFPIMKPGSPIYEKEILAYTIHLE